MTEAEAVRATVTLPAWTAHLAPVDHPRPWRLAVGAAPGPYPPAGQPDRADVHLTDAEVAALAETLLRPRPTHEPRPGRARLVRDGPGLLLRILVDPIGGEPALVAHVEEHHRRVLLADLARHRPDLIPTTAPPEPRLCLDPTPVVGLTIDQVAELHTRLGRWLDSEGIRATLDDRRVACPLRDPKP
ncbi:hypothetical protein [Embleya sp. NPDC059259]|uniref:hypothetical protein n=1 Tax=unclassified Embleya TaxID=2699296 RepID=UPI0036C4C568